MSETSEKKGPEEGQRLINITTVGDGIVGKTSLLLTYTTKEFPSFTTITVFDEYAGNITVDEQKFDMSLRDTAGEEDYDRLRPLTYPNTDCFLMCFSINDRISFENIVTRWAPEVRQYCPHIPIVLVATKIDFREYPGGYWGYDDEWTELENLIQYVEGMKLRARIKANRYVECSAKSGVGLQDVFLEAVRCVLEKPTSKRRR